MSFARLRAIDWVALIAALALLLATAADWYGTRSGFDEATTVQDGAPLALLLAAIALASGLSGQTGEARPAARPAT